LSRGAICKELHNLIKFAAENIARIRFKTTTLPRLLRPHIVAVTVGNRYAFVPHWYVNFQHWEAEWRQVVGWQPVSMHPQSSVAIALSGPPSGHIPDMDMTFPVTSFGTVSSKYFIRPKGVPVKFIPCGIGFFCP